MLNHDTTSRSNPPDLARNPGRTRRVAIYCHDSFGLGHLRRSLQLAHAVLKVCKNTRILLLTGSPRARAFDHPRPLTITKLPPVSKDPNGSYVSLNPRISLDDTVRARKRILRNSIRSFDPDLLIVDHTPTGLRGELLPLLADLRSRTSTRLVLGLRDILDEPSLVASQWRGQGIYGLLKSVYHEVWVYGSRSVFAVDELYGLPEVVGSRVHYLGYLLREPPPGKPTASLSQGFPDPFRPHLLCLVGGGGDGFPLAHNFLQMMQACKATWNGTVVTGPFLPRSERQKLEDLCSRNPNTQILRFTTMIEHLLLGSDLVITMGGYNSIMESLSLRKNTLVVPRVFPRQEQWLRAREFQRLGLLRALHPEALSPSHLAQLSTEMLNGPGPSPIEDSKFDGNGVQNFAHQVKTILAPESSKELHV